MTERNVSGLLASYGDNNEKKFWPTVSSHFSHYEPFWATYVLPLRDGPYIRRDVDERLEFMAQANYKCFLSVGNALANLENAEHSEIAYNHLQNAANAAQETVKCFVDFAGTSTGKAVAISVDELVDLAKRVSCYRNFIHEGVIALRKLEGVFYIPKAGNLHKYRRWSRLKGSPRRDFTPVLESLQSEFRVLCAILEVRWEEMLALAPDVIGSEPYHSIRTTEEVRHECPIVCSSNVEEGAARFRNRVRKM